MEIEGGRPKKYYPKPPSEALEATRLKFEKTMTDNMDQVLEELQPLYRKKEVQERPEIWIIRGEFNILARVSEMLEETERELMVAATTLPETLYHALIPEILRLKRRNPSIRILVTDDVIDDFQVDIGELLKIRIKEQMFGNGIISDSRRVMLLVGAGRDYEYLAICSDHLGLVGLSKEYFEYLWEDAVPI